jgi:hypothetical protein
VLALQKTDAPQELGSLQMPWLHTADWSGRVNIVVKDKVAFISSHLGKIVLIDLHDPRQPKNLGVLPLAGPVISLLASDRFLLAEVKKEGLVVIDVENSRAPEILGTLPLPGLLHSMTVEGELIWYANSDSNGIWSLPMPRRLQSAVAGDQLVASLAHQPSPGAYRFWLTDAQQHFLVPGVSWER